MNTVTLIKGDGIGPEVMDAAVRVVEATGAKLAWDEQPAGMAAIKDYGAPLPQVTLDSIQRNKLLLKGPLATPIGGGYRSVNVALRQEFELFANVRPSRSFEGVESVHDDVDLVVIRENTQGLYSGIEYYTDVRKNAAQAISLVTRPAAERVIQFAFEYAVANGRKKVTLVHKANILKLTTGLFLNVGHEIAATFPQIEFNDRIVDNMAMQLVTRPQQFEVIVTTNLFGDIISDLCAGLVGGLGLAPSANIGEGLAMFEAVHGTAPDIAGQGIANPTSAILSAAMMLRRLGYGPEAKRVDAAVRKVLAEHRHVTRDLGGTASTAEYADAIIAALADV